MFFLNCKCIFATVMKQSFLFLICSYIVSCSFPHYPKKYEKLGILTKDTIKEIKNVNSNFNKVYVQYLGCNNLLIKYKEETILFDPFFSNNRGLKAALGKIKFNEGYFKKGSWFVNRNNNSFSNINSVFISHSHYDHLLDLAYLLEKDSLPTNALIYGDQSTKNVIKNFIKNRKFNNSENFVYKNKLKNKNWIKISNNMRVLIIPSSHAPHFRHVHFMKGHTDSMYFNNFKSSTQLVKANQFKEGKTYAFIVDLLERDSVIKYRILIKGAGCEINEGKIEDELIEDKKIDLAILQIASANFTNCYPQNILNQIKPEHVLLTHWENFFNPYAPKKIKTVNATNFNFFFKKVKSVDRDLDSLKLSDKYSLPMPGTMHVYEF